jgi:hypothetical protein
MATDIQLVYTDIQTGRIARIVDYYTMVTPADLDDLAWQTTYNKLIPNEAHQCPYEWSIAIAGSLKKVSGTITAESKARIDALSIRAGCLEICSRMINVMRFRKTKHVVGYTSLVPMYLEEIKTYNETAVPGPLLLSLVDNIEDLSVAIAEFEIANSSYNTYLKSTEVLRNKWMRQIKLAEDPEQELATIRRTMGI